MKVIRLIVCGIAILAAMHAGAKPAANVAEMFGVAENLDVVRLADKVDVCLLRYIPPPQGKGDADERYEETDFVEVPSDRVAVIREALLAESTYKRGVLTLCWPRYHTRLRFHRGATIVAIDFCFSCQILQIARDGKVVGGGLFYGQPRMFLDEMKRIFPKDEALAKVMGR